jgi:CHAT domain-containing protein
MATMAWTHGLAGPEVAGRESIGADPPAVLALERAGDWAGLERFAEATLARLTRRTKPADAEVAIAETWLGNARFRMGRYEEAESPLRRALAIREATLGPDHVETADSVEDLAELLTAQERDDEAENLHRRALATFEAAEGQDLAATLDNLAGLLEVEGRHGEAEALIRRALAIYEKAAGPEDPETAATLDNLAGVLQARGRHAEAEGLLRRALAIEERALGGEQPDTAVSLDNLASLLEDEGRHAEAEPLARRALAVFELRLGPRHPDTATGADTLARSLMARGRYAEAEPLLRRALAIRERVFGHDNAVTAGSREALADDLARESRFGEAVKSYRAACPAHETIAAEAADRSGDVARTAKARAAECSAGLALALRGEFEASAGALSGRHPDALTSEAFEAAQRALRSAAGEALARSAALAAARADGVGKPASDYEEALAERDGVDKAFADAAAVRGGGGAEEQAALAKTRRNADATVRRLAEVLRARAPLYWAYRSPEPVSVAALQAGQGPDAALLRGSEALILFMIPPGRDRGLVFAISKDHLAWARLGLTGDELRTRAGRLRARIEAGRASFDRLAAYGLYKDLLGDPAIQAVLRDKPVLLIVPSGPLNSLPPALLVTAPPPGGPAADADQAALRATPWLLRTKAVALLPSVASLATLRLLLSVKRPQAPDPVLALADPDFRGSHAGPKVADHADDPMAAALRRLTPLPGTRIEGEALAAALGGGEDSLLLGADASKAQLMARNADGRLARVRVLEIATHGFVAGAADWLTEPALALAAGPSPRDGLLLASEASTLKLNADWVLLSACDTASPDAPEAEGLSGLSRAFFHAGARSLLVSHWPVRDDVAARLIPAALLAMRASPGLSRAEALREATLAIVDDPSMNAANPAAWAPFTLIGEAGP